MPAPAGGHGRAVYGPAGAGSGHSSGPAVADGLKRPTRGWITSRAGSSPPIWACCRWGLPCRRCRQRRGALLPHHFTLTRRAWEGGNVGTCEGRCSGESPLTFPLSHIPTLPRPPSAVFFLWHFPWAHARWPLAITVPCAVRTFLRRQDMHNGLCVPTAPAAAWPTLPYRFYRQSRRG